MLPVFVLATFFYYAENIFADEIEKCSDQIVINEIYPFSENEFVEVMNIGDKQCSLEGWSITDSLGEKSSDKHRKFFENENVEASGYAVVDGNLYMNDSGDEVKLWDENQELKETIEYKGKDKDKSFFLLAAEWIWNNNITKGKENKTETREEEIDENVCKDGIFLNEVNPFGDEFVEVYNSGEECDLDGWYIEDGANHKVYFESNSKIDAKGFFALFGKYLLNDSSEETVNLFNAQGEKTEEIEYEKPKNKERIYAKFEDAWEWTPFLTPNDENKTEEKDESPVDDEIEDDGENPIDENKPEEIPAENIPRTLRINEIFPNPSRKGEENEFVEIYNYGTEKVSLKNIILLDRNKKECPLELFADDLDAGEYLLVENKKKSECKISVHNSDGIFSLFDSAGNSEFFSINFSGSAKEDVSYGFYQENTWRWSEATPERKNIFSDLPKIEIKKPKNVYLNIFADFEVKINYKNKNEIKIVWDFGDGHKSYLQETRHKYLEKGIYDVSVKVSNETEDVVENFEIKVENYPHPEVKITKVNPNPFGKDSENETIIIKNQSKKTVNLLGWSVATGWENLYNHPINFDFEIKSGKERELTREFSVFSLNNQKTKIELRYPDGQVAYAMKYKNKESAEEGEFYIKKKNGGWNWIFPEKPVEDVDREDVDQEAPVIVKNNPILIANKQETKEYIALISQEERENLFEKTEKDNLQKKILKNKTIEKNNSNKKKIRLEDEKYRFTKDYPSPPHYAAVFLQSLLQSVNSLFNDSINKLI